MRLSKLVRQRVPAADVERQLVERTRTDVHGGTAKRMRKADFVEYVRVGSRQVSNYYVGTFDEFSQLRHHFAYILLLVQSLTSRADIVGRPEHRDEVRVVVFRCEWHCDEDSVGVFLNRCHGHASARCPAPRVESGWEVGDAHRVISHMNEELGCKYSDPTIRPEE